MEDTSSKSKNDVFLPFRVPPPPPPPMPKILPTASTKLGTFNETHSKNHFPDISRHTSHLFDSTKNIVSYYKPIVPVLQDGPSCGIVALSMASQFFPHKYLTSDKILGVAKESNFTKNGEMFSAFNMAKLASILLKCKTRVLSNISNQKMDIINNICLSRPVLVPYDADKNHEPCLNNGENAHWAVLCGVCFSVDEIVDFSGYVIKGKVCNTSSGLQAGKHVGSATKLCVYAYQGKSKHFGLWDFESLLNSNQNLHEITKKYTSDSLVLPDGNALYELRDKAVILG